MAVSRYAPDRGLSVRMGTTMFLLGLLYVAFMAVLIALLDMPIGFTIVIAGGLLWAQWFFSDRVALFSMGGHLVTAEQAPQLHAIVDRLCLMADMQKPLVAIADTDMPNAFATGRSPKRAVVCVTTGLLKRLDGEELEGVLSHELSHVAHRDVTVMTIASFVGVLAGFLTRMTMYSHMFGGGRRNQNSAVVFMAVFVVSILVYVLSFILTSTLSRYRELSADRTAALLTGKPGALGRALQKISGEMARVPTRDLRQAEAFNAFFFTPALAKGLSLSSIFATHPPLEKRLAQLARIQSQLGQ
jgi:heat shock protein HtpX